MGERLTKGHEDSGLALLGNLCMSLHLCALGPTSVNPPLCETLSSYGVARGRSVSATRDVRTGPVVDCVLRCKRCSLHKGEISCCLSWGRGTFSVRFVVPVRSVKRFTRRQIRTVRHAWRTSQRRAKHTCTQRKRPEIRLRGLCACVALCMRVQPKLVWCMRHSRCGAATLQRVCRSSAVTL